MTGVERSRRSASSIIRTARGSSAFARELGIARDTVRKVLCSGATQFSYKRSIQPQPKLGIAVSGAGRVLGCGQTA
jgi:hypothetical protein